MNGFDLSRVMYQLAVGAPVFLLAIVCHEWAHAFMAYKFGDDTSKVHGRLSFNPAVHIDPIGTVLFPLIGVIFGWTMFGWAKPVPIDPRRFKNYRVGVFWVAFAGPLMNILLALLASLIFAIVAVKMPAGGGNKIIFIEMLRNAVVINIILAVFNLIPFPPLDGSRMVSSFLSYENMRKYEDLQRYSFIFILLLWFTPILRYVLHPALALGNWIVFKFQTLFI